MQSAQNQMTRLRRRNRRRRRLQITHLTDHDHIRILTQRMLQTRSERRTVVPYLALLNRAFVAGQHILGRIFQRDDMLAILAVHHIDHARQRRTFARTRIPGHQHQPAGHFR